MRRNRSTRQVELVTEEEVLSFCHQLRSLPPPPLLLLPVRTSDLANSHFVVWTSIGRLDVGGIVTDIAQSVRGRARGEAEQRSIGEAI